MEIKHMYYKEAQIRENTCEKEQKLKGNMKESLHLIKIKLDSGD